MMHEVQEKSSTLPSSNICKCKDIPTTALTHTIWCACMLNCVVSADVVYVGISDLCPSREGHKTYFWCCRTNNMNSNNQINNRVMNSRGDLHLNTPQTILGCRESLVFFMFSNFCILQAWKSQSVSKKIHKQVWLGIKLKTQKSSALSQECQVPTYDKCSEIRMQNEEVRRFQKISALVQ